MTNVLDHDILSEGPEPEPRTNLSVTAHNLSLASTATNDMEVDGTAPKRAARFDSPAYDDRQTDMPALAPVSPCYSHASSASADANSITGRFSNVEYKYHVDPRVLGTGHHGSVRECVDRATGRRHAVKSIRKSDPSVKPSDLAREITLLREMRHRGIVRLVDVHEDSEYVHLVTDLCEGGELFDRIVERSSDRDNGAPCFAEGEAARLIHQILTAVSYMHERGVVHRDLKPENVLFETGDEESPIKIIDFGLSRKHDGRIEPPMRTVVGTPYYVAPEVLRKRYDKSCDLWSVGVISYILLCGYPPFNGANAGETYAAVRRGRYRFPSAEWSHTSREAREFISRLLRRDPRKRMTVDQALNHPWIEKHVNIRVLQIDEDRQDNSSVEVVLEGLPRSDVIICGDANKESMIISASDGFGAS